MISISLSPNTQPDDVRLAWRILLSPWLWRRAEVVPAVEQKLARRFNRKALLVSSGRAALYRTLAAYGIGAGDEVIIQAFTCLAVPASVQWTGAKPVYADIDSRTYNLNPADVRQKITPRTRAIIVQHTFGIPGPIDELRQLAQEHNLKLIEDLAHSLGGQYRGQMLGTFAHAAILSFGRDKTISSVFGGAIISGDEEMMARAYRQQSDLPYPPLWWVKQQLLHPVLMSFVIPLYFTARLGQAALVAAQKLHFLSLAVTSSEKRGLKPPFIEWRFSPALAYLLDRQLDKLDNFTARRRSIAKRYYQAIKDLPDQTPFINDANYLRVPLKVVDKPAILKAAMADHIVLGDWYEQPVTPSATTAHNASLYAPGSCRQAENVAKHVINLPTHPRMSDQDVDKVIAFILKHD